MAGHQAFMMQISWWSLRQTPIFMALSLAGVCGCFQQSHLVGDISRGDPGVPVDGGPEGGVPDGPLPPSDFWRGDGEPPILADGGWPASTDPDGAADLVEEWAIRIQPEEVARRLSLFVFNRLPTAKVTAAVIAAAPRTNQDVGRLTEGLLLDEGSSVGREAFYRWWLDLDTFATRPVDAKVAPAFTSAVRLALIAQTLAFIEDVTWREQGDLATLLTEPTAYVSAATAPWFSAVSVPAGGALPLKVALDPMQYAGLITQPAVVTPLMPLGNRSHTGRGGIVLHRYLCQEIPIPPGGLVTQPALDGPWTRAWLESNTLNRSECSVCHKYLDPFGFAFGHFNAVGAFQETDEGAPIDTSGAVAVNNINLAFSGAPDLARQMAALPETQTCYAKMWLVFATGDAISRLDTSGVVYPDSFHADVAFMIKRATIDKRLSLRGIIRAVTETHTFLD